jgi:Leucine-rich repeat (LRR) protein
MRYVLLPLLAALPMAAAEPVTELDLTGQWLTDAEMAKVARHAELRKLTLAHTRVGDTGFEQLKPLRNVVELNCYYCEFLTEDGIAHVRGWKNLERLNLRGTKVTSKVFEHLGELTALRELDIGYTQIDDEGFEHLAALTGLEKLAIGGNRLFGPCLSMLKLLPSLVELDVGGLQRVDSGLWGLPLNERNLSRLAELKQLRVLNLAGATLNDRGIDRPGHPDAERKEMNGLERLLPLVNLEKIDLSRTPATIENLRPLAHLPKLREIRLGLVTQVGEEELRFPERVAVVR